MLKKCLQINIYMKSGDQNYMLELESLDINNAVQGVISTEKLSLQDITTISITMSAVSPQLL